MTLTFFLCVTMYHAMQFNSTFLHKHANTHFVQCQRSYLDENTSTHSTTEVKHRRATIVLSWVTTWELFVALTDFFFPPPHFHKQLHHFISKYFSLLLLLTENYVSNNQANCQSSFTLFFFCNSSLQADKIAGHIDLGLLPCNELQLRQIETLQKRQLLQTNFHFYLKSIQKT